jgi:hypothetical protein
LAKPATRAIVASAIITNLKEKLLNKSENVLGSSKLFHGILNKNENANVTEYLFMFVSKTASDKLQNAFNSGDEQDNRIQIIQKYPKEKSNTNIQE